MKCNLPYLDRKDHPNSKHGKIEQCLKLMAKSGRKCFTAVDVEMATNIRHISVTRILVFTEGVDHMKRPTRYPKELVWYFNGDSINVPICSRKKVYKYKGGRF